MERRNGNGVIRAIIVVTLECLSVTLSRQPRCITNSRLAIIIGRRVRTTCPTMDAVVVDMIRILCLATFLIHRHT